MSDSGQTLIVDCDGVIADKKYGGEYAKAGPLQFGIDQVNKLYDMGFIITLYTARYGDRCNGNIHQQYETGYKECTDWLEKHGVKKIEALNNKFDHNFHQAMLEVESDKHDNGTVVQEIQTGFTMHDRLLRPSMVGV